MSGQIINSYRWTDKPVKLKQAVLACAFTLIVAALTYRYVQKMKKHPHVRAFTQSSSGATDDKEMKSFGILGHLPTHSISLSGTPPLGVPRAGNPSSANAVQERPLFDGMLVTLEVSLDQSLSSASGDTSALASIIAVLPGEGDADVPEGMTGAKLSGTFQANFDTERMTFQFQELRTSDGRTHSVAGIGFNPDDQSLGIPADYASGTGLRLLGAGLGTAINTAEQIGSARVLQNETAQDGFAAQELNQAFTQTGNQAGSSISDAATHDLKNTKAVLSLKAGTRFQVKLRAVNGASR